MNLHKRYIETDKPNQYIKFTIHFNKDTYHWATSQSKQKGYCVTATPVERGSNFEVSGAFTGFYDIIYPVERQSKKRLETAIRMLDDKMSHYIQHFIDKGFKFPVNQFLNHSH